MIHLSDIHPLTGFLRDHKAHLERLAATGRPEILTVNGKARLVIQDADSYQRMLQIVEEFESQRVIDQRIAELDGGETRVPAAEVLRELRERLGIRQ